MEFTRDCINNRLVGILFIYNIPYFINIFGLLARSEATIIGHFIRAIQIKAKEKQ